MKFKASHLEREFNEELHPQTRQVVLELDDFCRAEGLPEVTVTCVNRDAAANAKVGGVARSLHLDACACDIRSTSYSPDEYLKLVHFVLRRCPPGEWEVLWQPHGSGPHLHLARRQRHWKRRHPIT